MTGAVRQVAISLIELLSLLLLVRAVLSWFIGDPANTFYRFICSITDPILAPYRALFRKTGIGFGFPIDLSFLATILTLQLIASLL